MLPMKSVLLLGRDEWVGPLAFICKQVRLRVAFNTNVRSHFEPLNRPTRCFQFLSNLLRQSNIRHFRPS